MEKPQKKTLEYFDYFDCKEYLEANFSTTGSYEEFQLIDTMYHGNDAYYTVPSPGPTTFWNPETDEFRVETNKEWELFNLYWDEFVGEKYVQIDTDEDEREIVFWVSW